MPASTIFGNFAQAQQRAQQEGRAQENQAFNVEQQDFTRGQQLLQLTDQRKGALFNDARELRVRGDAGDKQGMLDLLNNRIEILQGDPNADPSQSIDLRNKLMSGDFEGTMSDLRLAEKVGMQATDRDGNPFLKDLEAEKLRLKPKGPALSDTEKSFKKLTSLEAQLSVAKKAGDKAAIDAATKQVNNFKTLSGKFGASTQSKADIAVDKANRIALSKQASDASGAAFKGLKNIRSTILNMGDAIRALDNNADTGPIISKLPSFREASIELDNIRGRMGLDVIGSVAFGALSESELAFALDTALPTDLQPKALKAWLKRKITVQRKLAKGLRDAAVFLGKPGNTIADYIERQELKTKALSTKEDLNEADAEELRQLEAEFGDQ